ncbi:hypothetical protein [Maribacter aquivivus]|uniref:hypothetical protein n=1 Tax=Maribacter aquivivus TaxID=228958 RepID=UPI0024924079|nr:hypothetical protein [Maribacter aquivivus]
MRRRGLILLIFLAGGLSTRGQDNPISEFDLYGCWIWERSENMEKLIYKRCEKSDSKKTVRGSKFSLLAFNKSEVQIHGPVEPVSHTENGTWNYSKTDTIVEIFYAQEWLKELKDKEPEEYATWGSPEKLTWLKFKIVKLTETQLEIKKLRTTRAIANRADND